MFSPMLWCMFLGTMVCLAMQDGFPDNKQQEVEDAFKKDLPQKIGLGKLSKSKMGSQEKALNELGKKFEKKEKENEELTMECCKSLLAVKRVIKLSSVAQCNDYYDSMGRVELLLKLGLVPKLQNATKEILNAYPFIAPGSYLQETTLYFGPVVNRTCFTNMQLKDKLSVAYKRLYYYVGPLYMAYSYEEMQGKHSQLAGSLSDTSFYLNSTVSTLRNKILDNKFQLPAIQNVKETDLDNHTRQYLQLLVDNKIVSLVITDDKVKTYRNYVILYTLHDVISGVQSCVYLL